MTTSVSQTELPLSLFQVLEEEFTALRGVPLQNGCRWLFTAEQLLISPSAPQRLWLTTLLYPPQRPPSRLSSDILKLLAEKTREILRQDDGKQPPSDALRHAVVDDLNKLLQKEALYTTERFADVALSPETREMVELALKGDDLVQLNRRLLEEAYPGAFANVYHVHQAALYQQIHQQKDEPLAALCFSGGGIRSATFNLGILQGLADHGLLERFDYLSTVSGGGYIGSWFTSWIHRHPEGREGVINALKHQSAADYTKARASSWSPSQPSVPPSPAPIEPEPAPIRHLRNYSNYMTPRVGLLSADTWTLAATYFRNLVLNWLVLVPLLAALLALPRLSVAFVREPRSAWWPCVALSLGTFLTIVGIGYISLFLPSANQRRQYRYITASQTDFLRFCLAPLITAAALLTSYWAWLPPSQQPSPRSFVLFGTLVHFCGWLPYAFRLCRDKAILRWWVLGEFALILGMGALGGGVVWLVATSVPILSQPQGDPIAYVCFAAPALLTLFLLAMTLFVGLASRLTTDDDREWWARAGAWCLIAIIAWSVLSLLVNFGPLVFTTHFYTVLTGGVSSGLFTLVAGHSAKSPATDTGEQKDGMATTLLRMALPLAAPLFVLFLIILLSLGTTALLSWAANSSLSEWMPSLSKIDFSGQPSPVNLFTLPTDGPSHHLKVIYHARLELLGTLLLVLLAVGLGMGFVVNINKFSLHATYRNRLMRAYLGATRKTRNPHLFTGFDPEDNVQMYDLTKPEKPAYRLKPIHVVNIALNLVKGGNLAWQQRKADSFTVSPLHCGSARLGYRRAGEYGGQKSDRGDKNGISLGTAVAISGAAASPNMGYHSSPAVTFLLAFFNIRLGWWLGNPGVAGSETFRRRDPLFAVRPLIEETFGLTNDQKPYVYLSDGGHFENLGLYEMVLRRCRYIVVVDAGCDPKHEFADLGNAIRKIRIDLGVPIEIEDLPIYSRKSEKKGARYAFGVIRYSCMDGNDTDGMLVYIKPALYETDEPKDVLNYALASPTFPHESTADQWFDESQFESHRMLGLHTVASIYK